MKRWELYIFDGVSNPYCKTVRWRWQVYLWMTLNAWRVAELRAILVDEQDEEIEHIVS